ncbi:hypothetical protein [Taibaiella koreensis]|uniref:hypothetical protein n=1 Tax=Taibaiella koreensis TaxID=1268548 RepID=UPI000E599797|nr:hypothetical protein [Taibaiella koreensis]
MSSYYKLMLLLLLAGTAPWVQAQPGDQHRPREAHFTGSISAGPNFYFNNIKTFGDHVKPFNYSFFGRIIWHSRYRVSLGIETGYNKFYRVNGYENDAIRASLAAIPMHLVIGMRLTKSVYTLFSFGPSLLLNAASSETLENHVLNKVLSLADGSFCVGYQRRIGRDFTLGAELKLSFSTKATDLNLALPVVLSYDF